ncbi:MAG: hypothetical protein LC793_13760 [Thermomicrobia bacterium]|nr:hypothetical protein [Thermomicrobia bacterium]MCA1725014.1 hypothetical protein [Thermomicrobia bacterium]
MVNINTVCQPPADLNDDEKRRREAEARAMRVFLASLPPPTPIEELARIQGVRIPQRWDDLPRWPEDDMEAWEGFDEFLEELRHDTGDLRPWMRDADSTERRDAMSIIQPTEGDDDTALDPKRDSDSPESGSNAGLWHSLTFEELARAQGVQPVRKLEDIMGGWPEDQRDDSFEDAIRAMRQEDLRREQAQ